uniref:Uncharacterized protein n=1 Tax=Anguilla anguilla TaxID=7936 RepID=A0A0E9PDQ2_ANGAN
MDSSSMTSSTLPEIEATSTL